MGFFSDLIDSINPFDGGDVDTSGINQAAATNASTAQEQLNFVKQVYADQAPLRQSAIDRANAVSDLQMDLARKQQAVADDAYAYTTETYRPMERGLAADAQAYDTPARRAEAASAAAVDVQSRIAAQRAASARSQASMGVNPNSGRAAALEQQASIAGAAATAGAMKAARDRVEQQGYARRVDAVSLGRNLPATQATSTAAATQAGTAALTSGVAPVSITTQGANLMSGGYNSAIAGMQSAGNLYGQAAQIDASASAANMAGLGNLAGAALAFYGMSR